MQSRGIVEKFIADLGVNLLGQDLRPLHIVGIVDSNRLYVKWMVLRSLRGLLIALPLLNQLPRLDNKLLLSFDQHHLWKNLDVKNVVIINKVLAIFHLVFQRHTQHVQSLRLLPLYLVLFWSNRVLVILIETDLVIDPLIIVVTLLEEHFVFHVLPLDFVVLDW